MRRAAVLLVEDNLDDVFLTRAAFERAKLLIAMSHVENGEDCMAFLRKEGRFARAPTPDVILLDLNMPRMDGREVLAEIAEDERLRQLPVIVLTSSETERDVLDTRHLRYSAWLTKPVHVDEFRAVLHGFGDYWFSLVVLPPKP
jgi:two-component system response regulator